MRNVLLVAVLLLGVLMLGRADEELRRETLRDAEDEEYDPAAEAEMRPRRHHGHPRKSAHPHKPHFPEGFPEDFPDEFDMENLPKRPPARKRTHEEAMAEHEARMAEHHAHIAEGKLKRMSFRALIATHTLSRAVEERIRKIRADPSKYLGSEL